MFENNGSISLQYHVREGSTCIRNEQLLQKPINCCAFKYHGKRGIHLLRKIEKGGGADGGGATCPWKDCHNFSNYPNLLNSHGYVHHSFVIYEIKPNLAQEW